MAHAKRASKRKHRRITLPALGAAGVSLVMAGGAAATAPTTNLPSLQDASLPVITLDEEEIADVSLGTFYVFDKENEPRLGQGIRFAARGCGGCGRCGGCAAGRCGGCAGRCGCAGRGCAVRCGGCGRRLVARLRWLRERRLRWRLLAVDVGPRLGLGVLLTEPRHLMGCGSLPEALSATSTSRRDLVWSASTDRLQIVCRRCARPSE
jgi:heterocycloanthracin/sonorensin family bacteriocin